ncbi:MAG TPA: CaiB/BaiF CoA-transferase family protein [Caldilineaceae bacterium]|nr:CaiB/BaiF CoA-transferase family protein [Caldilineaceae bacterium]
MTQPVMPAALDDITVLDLSRVLAGPYATMLLGDLGARIIKIEQPGRGDDTRHWGPPFTANGESAYFLCANRNKESVTLNLKHEAGMEVLRAMVQRADVLVENFKAGALAALGLDYESARALNPGLIYCSITGYGQTGPYRDRPGYDVVVEAQGGIMSITGPPDGEPYKVGVAIVDITAGMQAVMAILAALHYRSRTGQGQYLDIALLDTQIGWLANVASAYLLSGEPPKRYGNAHASIVPYQTVRTADRWLMLAVGNDAQFARLAELLGHSEWAGDARFAANRARVRHRDELIPLLEAEFCRAPAAEWTERLLAAGIPCSPVNDIPTALADPQVAARDLVQRVTHPQTGEIPMIGPAPKLSATPAVIRRPPPLLGEHTEAVLRDWLGYDAQQIAALRAAGAI